MLMCFRMSLGEGNKAEHLMLFNNELNNFNNTGAQILDYIYYMVLKLL